MLATSIDFDLLRLDEALVVVLRVGFDGAGVTGLLGTELVAWKEEDTEALVVVTIDESGEAFIAVVGEATL